MFPDQTASVYSLQKISLQADVESSHFLKKGLSSPPSLPVTEAFASTSFEGFLCGRKLVSWCRKGLLSVFAIASWGCHFLQSAKSGTNFPFHLDLPGSSLILFAYVGLWLWKTHYSHLNGASEGGEANLLPSTKTKVTHLPWQQNLRGYENIQSSR